MKISRTTLAIALSGTLALAGSATQATPISGGSLQSLLDGITLGGTSSIDVNADQYGPDRVWTQTATGISDHMVTFAGNNTDQISVPGFFGIPTGYNPWTDKEFILAWEDLPASSSDDDYDDFVVLVSNVMSVPEPGTLAIAGAGLLAFGFGMRLRRRS